MFLPFAGANFRHALKKPLLWAALAVVTAIIFAMFADILTGPFPMLDRETYESWMTETENRTADSRTRSLLKEYGVRLSEWDRYVSTILDYCHFCENNFGINGEAAFSHIIENRLSYADEDYSAVTAYMYAVVADAAAEERLEAFVPLDAETVRRAGFGGSMQLGSYEEAMAQLETYLTADRYTAYLGRRIGDIGGLVLLYACFVLYAMTFSRECAPEMTEMLHTKKMRPAVFVLGKYFGFSGAVILMGFCSMTILNGFAVVHCIRQGMAFSIWDLYLYYFAWVVPSMLMVGAMMGAFTLLCRTGIPLIPVLFFWSFGGTVPIYDGKGATMAHQYFWNITVRISSFGDMLFVPLDEHFYNGVLLHKLFQAAVILACLAAAAALYRRRARLGGR